MKKIFLLLSVLFLFSCTKETIKFTLTTSVNPIDAGTYYYQCSSHSGMVGTITIED